MYPKKPIPIISTSIWNEYSSFVNPEISPYPTEEKDVMTQYIDV